ncbi:MAG TPA: hypothetical protein IAB11_05525 [Candidatus Ornithoclostridium faecavium]|nr:hypothetical protein [Candidatus Ornithoclostridium faecavium]
MTRKRYDIAAVITALLLIITVALTFILGKTVENIVTGGGAQSAYAAEIAVDEGYVANGDVTGDYDPIANVPEGYTAQAITQIGWNSYISGKDNTNMYYYLTEDISISSYDTVTTLKGILDGNGHTITISVEGVLTTSGGTDQIVGGLFKLIDGGTVKNVKIVVDKYTIGADNVGTLAGIIAGQATNGAKIENVRVDLNWASTEAYGTADANKRNTNYLYDYNSRSSGAPNYLMLGGVVGDIAGDTTIDETTVSVNANAGNANLSATTVGGFGISGWRAKDDADRYYILGGFVGRVNSGLLTMTNVNLEGSGKIYNFNESEDGGGWFEASRNNYGYAGGFVGEAGGTAGGTLSINGLNYLFTGVLAKEHMNKANATGAIVGSGGTDLNKTTVQNVYYASTSTQSATWVMGDNEKFNGGIVYDISAPVYVSGGKLVIPAQQSTVWTEGKEALYSVTDRENNVYNVENYMIVADGSETGDIYLAMDMFANVEFTAEGNQQDYGKLYTLNYMTMGSADIADGFTYAEDTNTYSYSKTYDGVDNLKDISVKTVAGDKTGSINVFSGEKANSGAAGEYSFTLDKGMYAAAGVEEAALSNVEGNYLIDSANEAIYRMNVKDDAKISISIAKLAVSIAFNGAGKITYGDSLDTVKTNNPVSIISVGGVEVGETVTAPDEFTGYTLTGYIEKAAAGTEITLGISDVLMNGNEANYEFTLGTTTAVVAKYRITGSLVKDKFTTAEVTDGETVEFMPDTQLPDELEFIYGYATSADATVWDEKMPTESNRYYVKVTFDNANYELGTDVYTFTVTAVVRVFTTDKVIDGVFTTEYRNTAEKLVKELLAAVDYEAEDKEETDHFVFSIDGVEIADALNVSETNYTVTATLKSQRYEESSVTFDLKVVTQKIYITGDNTNASWQQLDNNVYDGADKTSFGIETEDDFAKTYTITYSATEDGEFATAASVKNAGYYKITAVSADQNYEIVDSAAGTGEYRVEKATPKVDFSGVNVTIAYGAEAVSGDTAPVISGVYDANTYTVSTLTESGETYTAASVNAGGKVVITTQDFEITENAENYNAVEVVSKEIEVDKAAVTVVTSDKNITYGDELTYAATDFYTAVNGLVGSDAVTADYTSDYAVKTSAGSVLDVILNFTFTNGNADNYLINNGEAVVAKLTVDKRTINGSVVAPEATYDGTPYDNAYIQSEGILEGDVVNCTVQYSLDGVNYVSNAPVDAGTYYVKVTSIDNSDYAMGEIAGGVQFNIVKAAAPTIVLTAKDGLVYDGKEKTLGDVVAITVEGLFAGDESLAAHVQAICLAKMLNAGDYTVTATLSGLANYEDAEQAEITVNIAKAPVTVTLKDNSVTYGDPLSGNEVYFVRAEGMVGNDAFSVTGYSYSEEYVAGQTGAGKSIVVTVEYTLDNADNYEVNGGEPVTARLNVVKRVLSGTINAENKKYDGKAYNGAAAVWNNLVGDDEISVTFEYSTDGRNYSSVAPVNAGSYYVRAAEVVGNGNYEVNALDTATFTVNKAAAPVINATAKKVVYNGSIINPVDTVGYTVSGLVEGDEALADNVNIYSGETILGAGSYEIGLVLKGLKNYEDAEVSVIEVVVDRADREISATARMGYGYIEIAVNERDAVEYSFDNTTFEALSADGRISADVQGKITVYLRYKQTDNYNQSETKTVVANITYDVLEEYVGRNYLNAEVSFENANEIATVLGWQDDATGEKSDTYGVVVGGLESKYNALMDSAKETVTAALNAGATLSGYQKLAATVISVSVGGLSLAVGALAIGARRNKKRNGGCNNEK